MESTRPIVSPPDAVSILTPPSIRPHCLNGFNTWRSAQTSMLMVRFAAPSRPRFAWKASMVRAVLVDRRTSPTAPVIAAHSEVLHNSQCSRPVVRFKPLNRHDLEVCRITLDGVCDNPSSTARKSLIPKSGEMAERLKARAWKAR